MTDLSQEDSISNFDITESESDYSEPEDSSYGCDSSFASEEDRDDDALP